MGRVSRLIGLAAGVAAAAAISAATQPAVLAKAAGGLWEVTGAPGGIAVRQCVADVRALAQFEHRGQICRHSVLSSSGDSAAIDYACGPRGFGSSRITVITPRSLRIETQGISDGLPFNYVIQARRVANCPAH